jgi:hypothetical protein
VYQQCIADGEHVVPEFAERWSDESGDRGRRSRGKEAGPTTAAFACVNLGSLLSRKGRLQEATEVWRKGMSYQDSGGAPLCAMNLGGLLAKNHDLVGARDA